MKKRFAAVAAAGIFLLSGCSFITGGTYSAMGSYDFSEMKLIQLEEPDEGQMMAVIETTEGTIKAVLYPDYAPNTIDNFVNRANEGYYDGKDVYAVVNGSLFMSGSYNDEGTQGYTNDGNPIPNEHSVDLWTFKGALCAYSGQAGYGDSRFFIVDEYPFTDEEIEELRAIKDSEGNRRIPDELIDAYIENGGVIQLGASYTVFGQTIEGFEVIEKICGSEVEEKTNRPTSEIKINSIEITEYTGSQEEASE